MLFHQGVSSSRPPAHRHAPLTHRSILVDQQVGIEEVVYKVRQPIALTWEEDKSKILFPWHIVHGPAQLGETQGTERCTWGTALTTWHRDGEG